MSVRVVVGMQWGDEGKGKIVDLLGAGADVVARYQGGPNAGHTVVVDGRTFVLHLVPSGVLHPSVTCAIGNGVVVDPVALFTEIDTLAKAGIRAEGRLFVSPLAHLIFPYHKRIEAHEEARSGGTPIGSTLRGIGPAYHDKAGRRGVRVCDLFDPPVLEERVRENVRRVNALTGAAGEELDADAILREFAGHAERLRPMMRDVSILLADAMRAGKEILLEGAQGTFLDLDHGTYPFVTSSSAVAGGAATGLGIGPSRIGTVIGVAKAYATRVGNGPFPTELTGAEGASLREVGEEYGATTGRPRRCGWLDGVMLRAAGRVNGADVLAITKMDVLDAKDVLRIATAYRIDGEIVTEFPPTLGALSRAVPVYEDHPGWKRSTRGVRRLADLPAEARRFLDRIERIADVPVGIVSVGSSRDETLEVART